MGMPQSDLDIIIGLQHQVAHLIGAPFGGVHSQFHKTEQAAGQVDIRARPHGDIDRIETAPRIKSRGEQRHVGIDLYRVAVLDPAEERFGRNDRVHKSSQPSVGQRIQEGGQPYVRLGSHVDIADRRYADIAPVAHQCGVQPVPHRHAFEEIGGTERLGRSQKRHDGASHQAGPAQKPMEYSIVHSSFHSATPLKIIQIHDQSTRYPQFHPHLYILPRRRRNTCRGLVVPGGNFQNQPVEPGQRSCLRFTDHHIERR